MIGHTLQIREHHEMLTQRALYCIIDTIDYMHGIGNPLYIRVHASNAFPVYIWQLKSDLHAAFAFILAPETLAL
jgi:hypothetical protein